MKAYAVATPERNPSLPKCSHHGRGGSPAFQAQAWNAIFAPKGTPPEVVAKLNEAVVKALMTRACASACSISAASYRLVRIARRRRWEPW